MTIPGICGRWRIWLAGLVCLAQFSQKFSQKVGMTPMEYLTRWRMLVAGDRLKSSEDSVQVICSSLGYETGERLRQSIPESLGLLTTRVPAKLGIDQPASS